MMNVNNIKIKSFKIRYELVSFCYRCSRQMAEVELWLEETINPSQPYRDMFAKTRPFLPGHSYCKNCAQTIIKEMGELFVLSPTIKTETGEIFITSNTKLVMVSLSKKTYDPERGFAKF